MLGEVVTGGKIERKDKVVFYIMVIKSLPQEDEEFGKWVLCAAVFYL